MDTKESRKKAIQAYKETMDVGGVYRYTHATGWQGPLMVTPNLAGKQNMFGFSKRTNTLPESGLKTAWQALDHDGFEIKVVESLTRKPEQSPSEFREELDALLTIYQEGEKD